MPSPTVRSGTFLASGDLHALARAYFDRSGKTQAALAGEMGISAPTVSLALSDAPKRAKSTRYDGTRAGIIAHLTGLSAVPGFRFDKLAPEDDGKESA